jgi:hypothetical protein
MHRSYPLPSFTYKKKIETIITGGLSTILKKAETRKWNGKKEISSKMQNIIDPFLASLYNSLILSLSRSHGSVSRLRSSSNRKSKVHH